MRPLIKFAKFVNKNSNVFVKLHPIASVHTTVVLRNFEERAMISFRPIIGKKMREPLTPIEIWAF